MTWFALKLEPQTTSDWADATAARVHDPLWFLTRQWQLGELQGENASTPVRVDVTRASRTLTRPGTSDDLSVVPAEPLVESEADDWWTLGRRLRIGRAIATSLGIDPEDRWLIAEPPAPYDTIVPAWDGRAMWRSGELAVDPDLLGEVPPDPPSTWVDDLLVHDAEHAFDADGVRLDLRRHRGGRLDWYSVDASVPAGVAEATTDTLPPVIPARIEYAGMPRTGVWEIEDPQADIGAVAPDAAHSATAIMAALFFSHHDEWFDIPVPADAGHLVRIAEITVTDSFGEPWTWSVDAGGEAGLAPPTDPVPTADGDLPWGLFHTAGLPSGELVLWQAVDRPLEGEVLERVQFGVDDQSNVIWAVERRLDQRDPRPTFRTEPNAGIPPPTDLTRGQAYRYVPTLGATEGWIPYTLTESGERILEQRRLVDFSGEVVRDLPPARAALLQGGAVTLPESVVPVTGMQVERRWMLARDVEGRPHLWIQRQRGPLHSAPARSLRFDVAVRTDAPSPA